MYGEWIDINDRVPDKNTMYAGEYGVPVIVVDMDEYGTLRPFDASFNFKEQQFQVLIFGADDPEWVQAELTHWIELPKLPILDK